MNTDIYGKIEGMIAIVTLDKGRPEAEEETRASETAVAERERERERERLHV
jgi:hypothetical protein